MVDRLDLQTVLDGLGEGVLIFDKANRLVAENETARTLLGPDLRVIRAEGWVAAAVLFNTKRTKEDRSIDALRLEAVNMGQPVRFHIYRAGEYLPCWLSVVAGSNDALFTVVTIERLDWRAVSSLLARFLDETREAVDATRGHAEIINQSIKRTKPGETAEKLGKRISGFTQLIATHMQRTGYLLDRLHRLGDVRSGEIRERVQEQLRPVVLADFMEDFQEALDADPLLDPESEAQDVRARIRAHISPDLRLAASPAHLAAILRDLLRNAMMYSMLGTPVEVRAQAEGNGVLVSIRDEGYGVRASEFDRVFQPFERARQPQVIGEFGYGLSLFLCKHEVEAMNGRLWFESEEGVGSTFSFKLPLWQDSVRSSFSSSDR